MNAAHLVDMPVIYAAYLAISIALTVWVARTLHRKGRVFLVETFQENEKLADSVNDLLVVGFYLINFGYVTLALRFGDKPHDVQTSIEFLATKIGLVLMILGGMHLFNLFAFAKIRKRNSARPHAAYLAGAADGLPPKNESDVGAHPATDFGRLNQAVKSSPYYSS